MFAKKYRLYIFIHGQKVTQNLIGYVCSRTIVLLLHKSRLKIGQEKSTMDQAWSCIYELPHRDCEKYLNETFLKKNTTNKHLVKL